MWKRFSCVLMLVGSFYVANCTATESPSQTSSRLTALAAILEDRDASIVDLSLQRAYVDPEAITMKHGSFFVHAAGKTVVLPELFTSAEGLIFVRCSEQDLLALANTDELRIWWCGRCKAFRSMDKHGRCTKCGGKL